MNLNFKIQILVCLSMFLNCSNPQTDNKVICDEVEKYITMVYEGKISKDSVRKEFANCPEMIEKYPSYRFEYLLITKRYQEAKSFIESWPDEKFAIQYQTKVIQMNLVNSMIFHAKSDTVNRDRYMNLIEKDIEKYLSDNPCDINAILYYGSIMSIYWNREDIVLKIKSLNKATNCKDFDTSYLDSDELFQGKTYYNIK